VTSLGIKTDRVSTAAWGSLVILFLMYMVSYLDRQILSLMVAPMKRDLHIDDIQISVILGASFAIFYGLVCLPMGWLVDNFSRRWIIFVGMLVWSVACVGCGFAGGFNQLLVGRFILGAGEATLTPAGVAVIGDGFPRRRLGLAINIFKMGALWGGVLSAIIGSLLIAWANTGAGRNLPFIGHLPPWKMVLVLVGLPGLVVAFMAFLLPKRPPSPMVDGVVQKAPLWPFLKRQSAYALTVLGSGTLFAIPSFAGQAWGATYLIRHYHLKIQEVGGILGAMALAPALGFLVFGSWADKRFEKGDKAAHFVPAIWCGPLLMTSNILTYVVHQDLPVFFCLLFVNGFLLTCFTPLDGHIQICSPTAYRGRTSALYGALQALLAISIGPFLVAFFTESVFHDPGKVGYGLAATTCIAVPLGMLVMIFGRKAAARAAEAAELAAKPA
jgi:MFS family permease